MKKKVVYTSIDGFNSPQCVVRSYKELSPDFCEWIEENTCKLLQKRTIAEKLAGEELRKLFTYFHVQPFFLINGRSYFLDFYIPYKSMAIEIDGKCHIERKEEDRLRDEDFRSIGVRTIRIYAKDVFCGKLIDVFNRKVSNKHIKKEKAKNKKKHSKKSNESKLLKDARKRLREHDKMKHNAKWI